jgi:hypothetical protein
MNEFSSFSLLGNLQGGNNYLFPTENAFLATPGHIPSEWSLKYITIFQMTDCKAGKIKRCNFFASKVQFQSNDEKQ